MFFADGDLEKMLQFFAAKKDAQRFFSHAAKNVARQKSRVSLLASRRLLGETAILTQMLRPRNSATAN